MLPIFWCEFNCVANQIGIELVHTALSQIFETTFKSERGWLFEQLHDHRLLLGDVAKEQLIIMVIRPSNNKKTVF
mgnify:CR=1 FL=1